MRPGIGAHLGTDVQPVATSDAARGVHDDVLAHLGAFGIEVLLHPQRPLVAAQRRPCAVTEPGVGQFQLGMPARGVQRIGNGQGHKGSSSG
ncbi:hypothetical protein D9M71_843320 [compost metagenome]